MSATTEASAALTPEQIHQFQEQGYLVVEDLIPPAGLRDCRIGAESHERQSGERRERGEQTLHRRNPVGDPGGEGTVPKLNAL